MSLLLKFFEELFYKNYLKRFFLYVLLVFTLVPYFFLIVYFYTSELSGDDLNYFKTVNVTLDWIINTRYLAWSSRIFIDSCIPYFANHMLFFKITCISLLLISPFVLFKLFKCKETSQLIYCFSVVSLFPYYEMQTAGFAATILNYYFPVVFGVVLCGIIYSSYKFSILLFIIVLVLGIFSCNHEQCVVIIFSFSLLAIIQSKSKSNFFAFETFAISVISLLFIIYSPGNSVRFNTEIQNWLPEFADFSFYEKMYMGITTTFYSICYHNNLPFVFCLVILVFCLTKKLRWSIATLIILSLCQEFLRKIFKTSLLSEDSSWLNNYPSFTLCFFVFYLFFLFIISFKLNLSTQNRIAIIAMIFLAFSLRGIVGFSPTVFASGVRTSIFSQCLFVICAGFALIQSNLNIGKLSILLSYFVYINFKKFIFSYINF